MSFTIIDIETTGLSKHYHKITEIAAAKIVEGEITETYQTLVNPMVRIPHFITRLTGIDNHLVRDSPTIRQVLPSFVKFLDKDIFVAHNATFDYGFLHTNLFKHHAYKLCNNRLCTRKLANRLYPELSRRRLTDLCEHLGVRNEQEHRAMADVKATAEIFKQMINKL